MNKDSFRRATPADAATVRDITHAENIAVMPERHGEGIGSVLLQRAQSIARSFRVNEMRLYFHEKFVANHLFYARRGFVEFAREPHPAGGEIVHMKKSLEA